MTFVQIGTQQIPATITGLMRDAAWDGRESKSITCEMTHDQAAALFVDGLDWDIVYQADSYMDPESQEVITPEPVVYDNSGFCLAGDITDHRDGTVTVKMGKLTDLEATLAMVYGGDGV